MTSSGSGRDLCEVHSQYIPNWLAHSHLDASVACLHLAVAVVVVEPGLALKLGFLTRAWPVASNLCDTTRILVVSI